MTFLRRIVAISARSCSNGLVWWLHSLPGSHSLQKLGTDCARMAVEQLRPFLTLTVVLCSRWRWRGIALVVNAAHVGLHCNALVADHATTVVVEGAKAMRG